MREGERRAAWVYRPTGKRWQGWESAPWTDPPDRVIRGASEVVDDLYLDDVIFVHGARHEGVPLLAPGEGVRAEVAPGVAVALGPVLAVAVGTVAGRSAGDGARAWIGFRYDAATGSDAFWTVPLDGSPARIAGAARAWLRPDGRACLAGPVSPAGEPGRAPGRTVPRC